MALIEDVRVAGTCVVVVDDAGLVLVVRGGAGLGLPRGPVGGGETVAEAAARVVAEQTGVVVEERFAPLGVGPGGAVCLRARPAEGDLAERALWIEPEDLDGLTLAAGVRELIEQAVDAGTARTG
ncbi:NUDIX domain-containing protein [Actinokineospora bangkokensis]|uniref:Nudix hydrolase domain-containing protein n=1 Tax=Actinokineospora bangkokensis TaxID=1193682 RepID=A0A1Q9LC39_9PSEU|nr:NUDIX domain-containing protein [Actinokineospora bangkokensis]OLR89579.1 hypothetical protein BJP25_05785 [Actinokineospora bangkokensis]